MEGSPFANLKVRLKTEGSRYFSEPMTKHNLDAVLSINNYSAGFAAVAHYPALTVPMGYDEEGKPYGLTFIGRPFNEENLLIMGRAFERDSPGQKSLNGFIFFFGKPIHEYRNMHLEFRNFSVLNRLYPFSTK